MQKAQDNADRSEDQDGGEESEAVKEQRSKAASTIQRNYRGYKVRRELQGLGLDPLTRWTEAVGEARYRNLITPRPKGSKDEVNDEDGEFSQAISNWRHASKIAKHAHGTLPMAEDDDQEKEKPGRKKISLGKGEDRWRGKMMDLPYFLEMVDIKHRYGSNLRAYHAEWKKRNTHDNFFYWLDHGEGRDFELSTVSRDRLDREQVRYLSREERLQYLVVVDDQGRLYWAKNGNRIDTSVEYRDSVEGIVPAESNVKVFREHEIKGLADGVKSREEAQSKLAQNSPDDETSSNPSNSASDSDASNRYPDPPGLDEAKGIFKLKHVSAGVILNRLLRKSTKKNTWIFVADTSMNLYVGIKQSGSFQHSSFINGSRVSAAGLIKIKHGQLRSLSPLSGHYRPPTAAFWHFIEHLKTQNVDMSRVSISKSYAVLVGLETYLEGKKRAQAATDKFKHGIEHIVAPDKVAARREEERDKSQSARLEEQRLKELEASRGFNRVVRGLKEKVEKIPSAVGTRHGLDGIVEGRKRVFDEENSVALVVETGQNVDIPDRTALDSTWKEDDF